MEKENLYPNKALGKTDWSMSATVLESYIRQKLELSDKPAESFAWQGGEPTLLGVNYFRNVVKLQQKYANGKKIDNAFQTNGILLNDIWCEFFANNHFMVGISIDGPREIHDKYRVDKVGNPTFDKVIRGINFLKKHCVDFNTLTSIQHHNANYSLEVYNFLKEVGSRFIQFVPIVERIASIPNDGLSLVLPDHEHAQNSDYSVEPEQFGKFLIEIFDEWVRHDVGRHFVQIFDIFLETWYGVQSGLCLFSKECGRALALEHNGDLYSCDHYVYQKHKLGNIMDHSLGMMVESRQQKTFGINKRDTLPRYCRECEVLFACNGECPKNRFLTTLDGEFGLNYLCSGYKMFLKHIAPYMRYMANELRHQRAPVSVMNWARDKDNGFPSLDVGRNGACPCGSGRKYKHCCLV
jgi:uncharacterized protein